MNVLCIETRRNGKWKKNYDNENIAATTAASTAAIQLVEGMKGRKKNQRSQHTITHSFKRIRKTKIHSAHIKRDSVRSE